MADAVVVGSGMGGLTAALALAREGCRVIVLERNQEPGGNSTVISRDGLRFEACMHQIGGLLAPHGSGSLLDRLGMRQYLPAARLRDTVTILHPGGSFRPGDSLDTYERALLAAYPEHSAALAGYVAFLRDAATVLLIRGWVEKGLSGGVGESIPAGAVLRMPMTLRRLLALQDLTFQGFLAKFFPGLPPLPELSPFFPYYGVPPSRVSALMNVGITVFYLAGGSWVPDGGSDGMTSAFVEALERHGGTIRTSCPAISIAREGRDLVVTGGDGTVWRAPVVVINAPVTGILDGVAAPGLFPAEWVARVRALRPSCSMVRVFATTDLPDEAMTNLPYETFVWEDFDPEASDVAMRLGEVIQVCFQLPHRLAPENRAPGRTPLILTGLMRWMDADEWRDARPALVQRLARIASRALPGLDEHLDVVLAMGPPDLGSRLSSPEGAMYGWESVPEQTSGNRLAVRTPAPGIYLASQWAQPGHGIPGVIRSGWMAANAAFSDGLVRRSHARR